MKSTAKILKWTGWFVSWFIWSQRRAIHDSVFNLHRWTKHHTLTTVSQINDTFLAITSSESVVAVFDVRAWPDFRLALCERGDSRQTDGQSGGALLSVTSRRCSALEITEWRRLGLLLYIRPPMYGRSTQDPLSILYRQSHNAARESCIHSEYICTSQTEVNGPLSNFFPQIESTRVFHDLHANFITFMPIPWHLRRIITEFGSIIILCLSIGLKNVFSFI